MLRASFGDGARLLVVYPDRPARVLSGGFYGVCDPEVSFDATRILFAGKRTAADHWNIYEASVDGSDVRQITRDLGNCRSPGYQSSVFTIVSQGPQRVAGVDGHRREALVGEPPDRRIPWGSLTLDPGHPKPDHPNLELPTEAIGEARADTAGTWHQLTFVSDHADTISESGRSPATHLYSCKLDGSAVRRLTFNLSSDVDPVLMRDGRLLFAAWQRRTLDRGLRGQMGLLAVNLDGADYALFAGYQGRRVKHMPCTTTSGLAVFIEAEEVPWDGAGSVSCVQLRRPLHSYRPITQPSDGLFHSPSPLPDGTVLISRRPHDGKGTHAVYRLDPFSGKATLVFDDRQYHDIQAKIIHPRSEPDGRSSAVTEEDPHGKLYCLNVYVSDLEDRRWMPPGTVQRLRVLEGVPLKTGDSAAFLPALDALPAGTDGQGTDRRLVPKHGRLVWPSSTLNGLPPLAQRRILGEIDVEQDGSFNVELPANTPVELQLLDADGLALRSCGWIWAKNHEPRGCIGCHEDGELTPENVFAAALERPSISLCLPPDRRRTVDFRRDVMPIIQGKCVSCHGPGEAPPRLDESPELVEHAGGGAYFNQAYESLLALAGSQEGGRSHGEYVHPGRARTSPLIWHVFGRNTSRGWDGAAAAGPVKRIPAENLLPLSDGEKRTFVEWIDMGAMWDGIPGADNLPGKAGATQGEEK